MNLMVHSLVLFTRAELSRNDGDDGGDKDADENDHKNNNILIYQNIIVCTTIRHVTRIVPQSDMRLGNTHITIGKVPVLGKIIICKNIIPQLEMCLGKHHYHLKPRASKNILVQNSTALQLDMCLGISSMYHR